MAEEEKGRPSTTIILALISAGQAIVLGLFASGTFSGGGGDSGEPAALTAQVEAAAPSGSLPMIMETLALKEGIQLTPEACLQRSVEALQGKGFATDTLNAGAGYMTYEDRSGFIWCRPEASEVFLGAYGPEGSNVDEALDLMVPAVREALAGELQ